MVQSQGVNTIQKQYGKIILLFLPGEIKQTASSNFVYWNRGERHYSDQLLYTKY